MVGSRLESEVFLLRMRPALPRSQSGALASGHTQHEEEEEGTVEMEVAVSRSSSISLSIDRSLCVARK